MLFILLLPALKLSTEMFAALAGLITALLITRLNLIFSFRVNLKSSSLSYFASAAVFLLALTMFGVFGFMVSMLASNIAIALCAAWFIFYFTLNLAVSFYITDKNMIRKEVG